MREGKYKDPRKEDIVYDDRRISRPDVMLPDWEVPDSTYRPVPIVWFTGALLLQLTVQTFLSWLAWDLFGPLRFVVAGVAMFASGMIWNYTWQRGMHGASRSWQIATATMLTVLFLLLTIPALKL